MIKLKRSPKNLELDINLAEKWAVLVFPQQTTNSTANSEFCSVAWKSACCGILLALVITWYSTVKIDELASLKPRTHDKQMLANNCWQTFVGKHLCHTRQHLLDNSMAEMAESAHDDDVAAAVICLIARKWKHYHIKSICQKLLPSSRAGITFSRNLPAHPGVLMPKHFAHRPSLCVIQSLVTGCGCR